VNRPLQGKVALVTGGAIRLGAAISRTLAGAGAHVAVHSHRSSEAGRALVIELRGLGATVESFTADLTGATGASALAHEVESRMGAVSILINNAARFDRAPLVDTSFEVLESQWALNARAPFLLTQAVAKGMLARKAGDVVNILDIGGVLNPVPNYSAYGMTKAALAQLTQTLAVELAPHVRVNAVAPGSVLPPETYSDPAREALRAKIPQGRLGSPQDIADTVMFLLTGPQFMTGQIVAVDGGRSLVA
jgi:pteridine reductase